MLNAKQPLWLPPGSIRALLALALVFVTCVMALTSAISGEAFLTIASAVVAFYFGTKAGAGVR